MNPRNHADSFKNLKVAIVHYWFVRQRGGERVVEAIADLFPQAEIFAVVANPNAISTRLQTRGIHTSFLQKIPGSIRWHRYFVPLYPFVLEQFDFSDYDLVISSESGPAKGVITGTNTLHICYCHTPMRYLWDAYHAYRSSSGFGWLTKPFFSLAAHYLRLWDTASASRVDHFVANSETVAARIRKHYRRDATVIFPPVSTRKCKLGNSVGEHYLVVSYLADYKRVDLAIEACNRLKRKLRIIGEGEQLRHLRSIAGSTIEFLGAVSDDQVRQELSQCRALLFPGEEDFGIVPVEAMASGRPVIAFAKGGATETIVGASSRNSPECSTGIFFHQQTPEALIEAIRKFESVDKRFVPTFVRSHAEKFDLERFNFEFGSYIDARLTEFRDSHALNLSQRQSAQGSNYSTFPPRPELDAQEVSASK